MGDGTICFDCEVWTAAFLHGAKQGAPELRAAPFKGLARYWLRALAAEPDPRRLFRLEAEVFGGACKAKGASRRGVSFAVALQEGRRARGDRFDLLPHKQERRRMPSDALQPRRAERRRHGRRRGSSSPGVQFQIRLVPFGVLEADREALEAAAGALWVGLHLGGVGQRSRRGAGHVRVTRVHGWKAPSLDRGSAQGYAATLGRALCGLQAAVRDLLGKPVTAGTGPSGGSGHGAPDREAEPVYPCLAEPARVQVCPLTGNPTSEQEARAALMKGLRGFKSPAMGLPYGEPAAGDHAITRAGVRHASPVWITLDQLDGGAWVQVETFLGKLPGDRRVTREHKQRVHAYLDRNAPGCVRAWPTG